MSIEFNPSPTIESHIILRTNEKTLAVDELIMESAPVLVSSECVIDSQSDGLDLADIRSNLSEIYGPSVNTVTGADVSHENVDKASSSVDESKVVDIELEPKLKIRLATMADIPEIVDVDMRSFKSVYKNYDIDNEELRNDLIQKFSRRLEMVGGEWMPVIESEGKILGFMTCCPTNKSPEDFESWEDTTDNGTLESTYDPDGKNVYIVTLSVLHEASKYQGQNMLFANQIGNMLKRGYTTSFFESRLPGLQTWVKTRCNEDNIDINSLTEDQKLDFAEVYFNKKTLIKGKEVPYDRLIRIYAAAGCKFLKVAPNAYADEQSMNFGVVCVYNNPLPEKMFKMPLVGQVLGAVVKTAAKSQKIMKNIF